MGNFRHRSTIIRKPDDIMRFILPTFFGVILGFLAGVFFSTLLNKLNLPLRLLPTIDLSHVEDRHHSPSAQEVFNAWKNEQGNKDRSTRAHYSANISKIWVPTNPRGAERLPPNIVEPQSDLYLRRLWGNPDEDLTFKQKYLVTFTVGYGQRKNIDAAIKKFSGNFTIMLFHYDGRVTEWDEYEWSKKAIHVSIRRQTKWWYAKRFLHPDIVAPFNYIFIWDEDLGVEHFNAEE